MVVGIAIGVMVSATVAVHMGLPQEVAKVVAKICGCPKCLSFWLVLVTTVTVMPIWVALLLSLFSAYVSGWFALVLVYVNKWYEKIWEKVSR